MNILISHCLLGEPCRYDGLSKAVDGLERLKEEGHTLIPVCPEVMGGLPTPRPPAERQEDGQVINRLGEDVTDAFRRGAERALAVAKQYGCTIAILKANSPSCGSRARYDGSFTGKLIPGQGLTAQLLTDADLTVLDETQLAVYFP